MAVQNNKLNMSEQHPMTGGKKAVNLNCLELLRLIKVTFP